MPQLAFKLWLISLPVLAVVAVNYSVDPAHAFRHDQHGVEEDIVNLLMKGQTVAIAGEYDWRLIHWLYIEKSNRKKDVIVLGSSRSMGLRADVFPGRVFFNNSIPAGTIQDFIGLYGVYRRRGVEPGAIYLNVDPWIFNRNNGFAASWTSLSDDYVMMAKELGLMRSVGMRATQFWPFFVQLLSPAYFQRSMKALVRYPGYESPRGTDATVSEKALVFPDGSIQYPREASEWTPAHVRRLAASVAAAKPVLALGNFRTLDREVQRALESFVDFLQRRDKQVILLLVPFHPLLYAVLVDSPEYRAVLEVERYVRDLAARRHVALAGSYDPAQSACSDQDFFDAVHPKLDCMVRILGH